MPVLILIVLFLIVVFSFFLVGSSSSRNGSSGSVLIKDNVLRYEKKDEKGRKKKVSFNIAKIDDFLVSNNELYMSGNTKLIKKDKNARANANTLYVVLEDGRILSLRDLNRENPDLYNRICSLLDRIKDKDAIDLSFRMRKYALEDDLVYEGKDIVDQLKALSFRIKDDSVREKIDGLNATIKAFENDILSQGDKVRKLYDHYLPMLVKIVEDYIVMEGHDESLVDLSSSRKKLSDTVDLINSAFLSLKKGNEEDFEALEADVNAVSELLKKA